MEILIRFVRNFEMDSYECMWKVHTGFSFSNANTPIEDRQNFELSQ